MDSKHENGPETQPSQSKPENGIKKMIEAENHNTNDEFFSQKFNLKLSSDEDGLKLKPSTALIEEMKLDDRKKLRKFQAQDNELPSDVAHAPFNQIFATNNAQQLRDLAVGMSSDKHYDLFVRQYQKQQAFNAAKKRHGEVMSKILYGRLGVDTFFVLFGILGVFMIPWYFWNRKEARRPYTKLAGIDPSIIENLHEDDPDIDLDDVSYHVNFYDLRESREEARVEREKEQVRDELIKDVYGKGRPQKVARMEFD
jgi:hypothetical protein